MRGTRRLLAASSDPRAALLTIVFVSLFRLVLEHNAQGLPVRTEHALDLIADRLVFYAALFHLFVAVLRILLPGPQPGSGNVVAVGLLFGLVPPVLAAFVPALSRGGYAYLNGWQWLFYDPTKQALAETITLWSTVAACGAFVLAVTRSVRRAIAALALTYAGLAWILTVLPSLILSESLARGAPEAWPLRVAMLLSAASLFAVAQPGAILAHAARGAIHTWPYAGAAAVAALWVHAGAAAAVVRAALVAALFLRLDRGTRAEPPSDGAAAFATWSTLLVVLLLLTLATRAAHIALLGALVLLVRSPTAASAPMPQGAWLERASRAVLLALALALGAASFGRG